MRLRPPPTGLCLAAAVALLGLAGLLLALRAEVPAALAGRVDLALGLTLVLLPLPALCAWALYRRAALARELQAATDAQARLLARLGHEIRTPMSAVMGMNQLALQTPLSAEQRELLARADAAARLLLGRVDDMLDLARIEAGQLQVDAAPLRLETVVAQAIEQVRPLHTSAAVELVCDWADASLLGPHGSLLGDAARLQQALVNLLANALRFTPAGQVMLRIAARPSLPDGRVPLRLVVQDSGVGMDEARLAALWREPAPDGQPGGLGLRLTRHLVERMGGSLDLESQPGRGSSFEIRLALPLATVPALPAPEAPAPRLLLAEGRRDSRHAATTLLQSLGLAPATVADVQACHTALADALAAGRPFDWLLLDWRLPADDAGRTGLELLASLRRDHPALRIAVIGGPGDDDSLAQARAFGAREVLARPLLPGELRRLLQHRGDTQGGTADAQALAGLRVLLVEDHPVNQEIAQRLLGSRGAQVEVASDGQQGLDRLQAGGPDAFDLVLMDLQMPVLDGLAATRRLRQWPGFEALPVLAMTAHAQPEERARCLAAGMQGHIAKPLDVERLVRELQAYRRPATPAPLPQDPVLDLGAGLRRFDGQAALYRRTLRGFADQYAGGLDAWSAWLAAGQWTELRRAAHTLQGLAATLGAQPLHALALALERSALAGDARAAAAQLQAVQAGLGALLAALARLPPEAEAAQETAPARPGDLAELRALLAGSDSRALDWWQNHGAAAPLDPATARQVGAALAALDFDAALAALDGGAVEAAA